MSLAIREHKSRPQCDLSRMAQIRMVDTSAGEDVENMEPPAQLAVTGNGAAPVGRCMEGPQRVKHGTTQ